MTVLPTFPALVASPLARSIAFVIGGTVRAALAVRTVRSVAQRRVSDVDLRCRVVGESHEALRDKLFTQILERIDQSEGRVAMASMTVHLVETPTFDVRLAKPSPPAPTAAQKES